MDLREIEWGTIHLILLAQDREKWRALVNTVMNFQLLNFFFNSSIVYLPTDSQEGLYPVYIIVL
jgi:hypothetical protein